MSKTVSPISDQPVPFKAIGKLSGWSGRALHYPIFSPTWLKFRLRGFVVPVCLLLAVLVIPLLLDTGARQAIEVKQSILLFGLSAVTALFLGRVLAVRARTLARQRQWSGERELAAIAGALLLGVLVAGVPMYKSNSLNRINQDRYAQALASQATPVAGAPESFSGGGAAIVTGVTSVLLLLWLGGGLDLLAYLRQRRALQEAAQQEVLERYRSERNHAEMRLSVLASQVEPHFLFNTLAGVRSAMLNDPARGVLMIDHLVDYLRTTIPQMRSDGSSTHSDLRTQFAAVRAYLGIIKTRMPRMDFEVTADAALLDLKVPPLMLISLVENAVKHGIEPKKGPARLSVSAALVQVDGEEKLTLCVKDDGVGFGGASSGSGIGLANVRERLAYLYGEAASLRLAMGEGGGVEASICLPPERA